MFETQGQSERLKNRCLLPIDAVPEKRNKTIDAILIAVIVLLLVPYMYKRSQKNNDAAPITDPNVNFRKKF